MKIDSEYTQDEAFRPYKIVIQVESNADQEALRNILHYLPGDTGFQSKFRDELRTHLYPEP